MSQTNKFSIQDDEQDTPSSQLDMYNEAVRSVGDDELADEMNLGLGNYSTNEYWQQIGNFRQSVYADAALSRRLEERAVAKTKRELGRQGFHYFDENDDEYKEWDGWQDLSESKRDRKDRDEWIEEQGEKIWNLLNDDTQAKAVVELSGYKGLKSPHMRMMSVQHDMSRSKDARLLDNLFGRVKEVIGNASDNVQQRLG